MMAERLAAMANILFAVTVPFTHIGGYIAGVIALACCVKNWKKPATEPAALAILAFVLYGAARSIFSAEPAIGYAAMLGYLSHWLLPFIAGYSVKEDRIFKKSNNIYFTIFTAIVALSVLAYLGLFIRKFGGEYFLVGDEGLLKGLRSHIALAALCLVFSFIALERAVRDTTAPLIRRSAYGLLAVFFLAALFLTGSRGYYIAAVITYGAYGTAWFIRSRNWTLIALSAVAAAVTVMALYSFVPIIRNRLQNTNFQDNNVLERLALYKVALNEIKDRPLAGYGPGQGIRQKAYTSILPERDKNVMRHPHLHSFYLNLGADFGIIGILLFAAVIFNVFKGLLRASLVNDHFLAFLSSGMLWGFSGVLIGDMFDTLLRGPGTAMELFWLIGLIFGQLRTRESK